MFCVGHVFFLIYFQKTSSNTEQRVEGLKHALLILVYQYVSQSLYKKDRTMFALHLAHGMKPEMFQDQVYINLMRALPFSQAKKSRASTCASCFKLFMNIFRDFIRNGKRSRACSSPTSSWTCKKPSRGCHLG